MCLLSPLLGPQIKHPYSSYSLTELMHHSNTPSAQETYEDWITKTRRYSKLCVSFCKQSRAALKKDKTQINAGPLPYILKWTWIRKWVREREWETRRREIAEAVTPIKKEIGNTSHLAPISHSSQSVATSTGDSTHTYTYSVTHWYAYWHMQCMLYSVLYRIHSPLNLFYSYTSIHTLKFWFGLTLEFLHL